MIFANIALLITAVGILIPIIIHLISKQKPKPINIPTVYFIKKALEKSSSSRKINNILLLICRILILLLLTLFLARPKIESVKEANTSNLQRAIFILDNSYYSAQADKNGSQLELSVLDAIEALGSIRVRVEPKQPR